MINFRGVGGLMSSVTPPPTWSWMAYQGAIEYLDVPFGQVNWLGQDMRSPWSSSAVGTWSYSGDRSHDSLELTACIHNLDAQALDTGKRTNIIFDDPAEKHKLGPRPVLKCIVLGASTVPEVPLVDKVHYVLVVRADVSEASQGRQVYTRTGAGSTLGRWIDFSSPGTPGRVR